MDIRTNYPIRQTQISRSKNMNRTSANSYQTNEIQNNQVNFTGLPSVSQITNYFKPTMKKTVIIDKEAKDFLDFAGSVLDISTEKATDMVKGKTIAHMSFLASMVERINTRNFYKKSEKDAGSIAIDLFKRIEQPQQEHISFIRNIDMSMEETKRCFDKCADDPKKLAAIENVYDKLGYTKDRKDITMQIVDSPNTKEYVKNIDKYIPHFNAVDKLEGLIAGLDKTMGTKTHDINSLVHQKEVDRLLSDFPKTSVLSKEKFLENYNDEGRNIISSIKIKMNPTKQSLEEGDAKGLIKIFNSTTPENAKFRENFLEVNYHNYGKRDTLGKNEINELSALFELADKDPNTMKFLTKFTELNGKLGSAKAYFDVIDIAGSERLSKEVKTVKKLSQKGHYDSAEAVIEHFSKPEGSMSKFVNSLKGLFGAKKAPKVITGDVVKIEPMTKLLRKTYVQPEIKVTEKPISEVAPRKPYITPEIKVTEKPVEIETPKKSYVTPENQVLPVAEQSILPTGKLDIPAVETTPVVKKPKRSYLTFKPVVSKAPDAKKLAVINDVNGIIEKKLGAKTLDEQLKIYADKATKMRLNMLPEIFESIKDTRAAERANGTFNKRKSISNSDAVDLYTRINGKNKRLVNYMLKKRNADGTRMFSVKDIMETLSDANRSILEGQKHSTKANRFTAKDEKAIYDAITDKYIAEHGKLTKVKTSAKKK